LPDAPGRVDISRPPCDDRLLLVEGWLVCHTCSARTVAHQVLFPESRLRKSSVLWRPPRLEGFAIPVRIPLQRGPGSTFAADLTDLQAEGSRGVLPNATGHHKGSPQPVNRRVEPNSSRPLRFTGLRGSVRAPPAAPAQPPRPACTCSTSPGCSNPRPISAPSLSRWLPSISSSVNHAPTRPPSTTRQTGGRLAAGCGRCWPRPLRPAGR
jgi:hypothetical protein